MTPPLTGVASVPQYAKSSPISIALAWLAVGLPLAWGVLQTIVKSLALFQ
jgi:hypothetical protein